MRLPGPQETLLKKDFPHCRLPLEQLPQLHRLQRRKEGKKPKLIKTMLLWFRIKYVSRANKYCAKTPSFKPFNTHPSPTNSLSLHLTVCSGSCYFHHPCLPLSPLHYLNFLPSFVSPAPPFVSVPSPSVQSRSAQTPLPHHTLDPVKEQKSLNVSKFCFNLVDIYFAPLVFALDYWAKQCILWLTHKCIGICVGYIKSINRVKENQDE